MGFSAGGSHLNFMIFILSVRTNSEWRWPWLLKALGIFIWISTIRYDVTLCCLCVPSVEQDGLALRSTHRRENKNWQQVSLREAERRRSEVEFYYWNWIPSQYWNFESHHLLSPSLVLSFALCLLPLFTSMCLKGELTELACRPGQTEKHLVRREEAEEGQMKSEGKLEGYKWEGEERKRKSHSSLYSSSFLFNCLCSSLPLCPFLLVFLLKSVISEDAYS